MVGVLLLAIAGVLLLDASAMVGVLVLGTAASGFGLVSSGAGVGLVAMMLVQQEQLIYASHSACFRFGVFWCGIAGISAAVGGLSSNNPAGYRSPNEWQMPYEDVYITGSDGVVIHAWFIKQEEPVGARRVWRRVCGLMRLGAVGAHGAHGAVLARQRGQHRD